MNLIETTVVFLLAAVVLVPLFRRIGFSAVLAYLFAGLLIDPLGVKIGAEADAILHFAEIGVVMLLFVIGLELQLPRLRAFRRLVFGLGLAQVAVTSAAIGAIAIGLGLAWQAALVIGLGLSLSSTAMVLQLLSERGDMLKYQGRAAFGTLLFQDIVVIPILAALPLLAPAQEIKDLGGAALQVGLALAAMVAFVVVGRVLLRHVLGIVAASGVQEAFTAVTLLLVLASGLLFEVVGLSMGLGAFMAGLLVADSEYRHQLETDIAPFKGLLLGLFFIAIGMSIDLRAALANWDRVVVLTAALVTIKGLVVLGLVRSLGETATRGRAVATLLAQGGEFAFVIFTAALGDGILDPTVVELLVMVVTLSMVTTPFVLMVNDWLIGRSAATEDKRPFDEMPHRSHRVIIAGFGRFGQMVGRLLAAQQIPFTALESSASQVDFVRGFGNEVYYGDPRRLDLLRTAHVEDAAVFVLAMDDAESSLQLARLLAREYPQVPVYARARNRTHALELMELGAKVVMRELLPASIEMGSQVLQAVGVEEKQAERAALIFREHDAKTLLEQRAFAGDRQAMMAHARDAARELQYLFERDHESNDPDRDR